MLNIVRHSPSIGEISPSDPFNFMDDWLKDFGKRSFFNEIETGSLIKVDLSENDTAYTIRAAIPGVNKEDIKVQVDGNRVSISTETKKEKKANESFAANVIKVQVTEALVWIVTWMKPRLRPSMGTACLN